LYLSADLGGYVPPAGNRRQDLVRVDGPKARHLQPGGRNVKPPDSADEAALRHRCRRGGTGLLLSFP
jgi:hypothetical protein